MALKEQIDIDLKAALLGGDRFKGEVLRGLKAAILNEEVAQKVRDEGLADEAIEQLIARKDSASQYTAAGRPELSETELKESAILELYLPAQASEADIQAVVTRVIAETGATGMAQMGQVIGAVKKELGNSADGALVAQLVKNALQ